MILQLAKAKFIRTIKFRSSISTQMLSTEVTPGMLKCMRLYLKKRDRETERKKEKKKKSKKETNLAFVSFLVSILIL